MLKNVHCYMVHTKVDR
uniref:Uncharacterized protein n=1 Tax=Arundo donax TaxID=35708 RepID=A0A0A9FCU2_ARUDO